MLILIALIVVTVGCGRATAPEEEEKDTEVPEMVLIPAGEFAMGTSDEEIERYIQKFGWPRRWFINEQPQRKVFVGAFHIDRFEVTNSQYKEFTDATGHEVPDHWSEGVYPEGKEDHPVVFVSWYDAQAYCQWVGKRLPTEAEWEKAARGTDGRTWPWGDEWDPRKLNSKEGEVGTTAPAGSYPDGVGPYGLYDMAGNVWEWTGDWFGPYLDPHTPPDSGKARVLRGGSFLSPDFQTRCAFRPANPPDYSDHHVGFRCAKSPK